MQKVLVKTRSKAAQILLCLGVQAKHIGTVVNQISVFTLPCAVSFGAAFEHLLFGAKASLLKTCSVWVSGVGRNLHEQLWSMFYTTRKQSCSNVALLGCSVQLRAVVEQIPVFTLPLAVCFGAAFEQAFFGAQASLLKICSVWVSGVGHNLQEQLLKCCFVWVFCAAASCCGTDSSIYFAFGGLFWSSF